jgi:hypothetical protein
VLRRAALVLALTLATAANAARSLKAAPELGPDAQLVQLDADARAQLDALCDELIASLAPKNSRQGVSAKNAARIGARAPPSAERVCEIFAVEGGVVVVAGKYAFAGFDPINNWDPFGLQNRGLTCTVGDPGCFGPERQRKPLIIFKIVGRTDPITGEPLRTPNLQMDRDLGGGGAEGEAARFAGQVGEQIDLTRSTEENRKMAEDAYKRSGESDEEARKKAELNIRTAGEVGNLAGSVAGKAVARAVGKGLGSIAKGLAKQSPGRGSTSRGARHQLPPPRRETSSTIWMKRRVRH